MSVSRLEERGHEVTTIDLPDHDLLVPDMAHRLRAASSPDSTVAPGLTA